MASTEEEMDHEDAPMRLPHSPLENKRVYKSWRKKYRKMKVPFDQGMKESTDLFVQEHKAWGIARRLQEQNDQLLDLLLEINDSPNTSSHLRYHLDSPSPHLSALPELESDHSDEAFKPAPLPLNQGTSLDALARHATHTPYDLPSPSLLPTELLDFQGTKPPNYMTPEHEEEYINALDSSLCTELAGGEVREASADLELLSGQNRDRKLPSEREMALDNPVSVHNWLRLNQPQVFENKDFSEKPVKSEAGGRRKKDKGLKEEPYDTLDEELGFDPRFETSVQSGRGKRKKDDDAYRPKGGSSRSAKRKRAEKEDPDVKPVKKARKSGLSTEIND